ncbi:MAG TPA: hypothetical protein VKS60_25300 [Stellaceae bacterium]|nr:hypothetical protein [Stellaceae bacterium]
MNDASDERLVAYLDGELDEAGIAEIEASLERDPELRQRLRALSEATVLVRDAFDEVLREPVPPHLLRAASVGATSAEVVSFPAGRSVVRRLRMQGWIGMAAAAAVTGIVFLGASRYLGPSGSNVLDDIAATHDFIVASADAGESTVFDVPAGSEHQLPVAIRVPDMKPWGLTFKGARHTVVDGGKSAYLFYFDTDKDPGRITVAIWPTSKSDAQPTFEAGKKDNQIYWRHAGHGYAITGQANKGYMWNMAQDISWQLRNS